MKKYVQLALWTTLLTLAACGGGGGGSSASDPSKYSGPTSPAPITASDASKLATNTQSVAASPSAFTGFSALSKLSSFSGKPENGLGAGKVSIPTPDNYVGKPVESVARFLAARTMGVVQGTCGGFATLDPTSTSSAGSISFSNYCTSGQNGTQTMNGSMSYALSNSTITVTFSSFSLTTSGGSSAIDGTFGFSTAGSGATLTQTLSLNCTGSLTSGATTQNFKFENFSETMVGDVGFSTDLTVSGKFYLADSGYVILSVPTAIHTAWGDLFPSSGILIIEGAQSAKLKITYVSNTQYTIAIDPGTGTYGTATTYSY